MWAFGPFPGSPLKMGGGIFTRGVSSSSESESGLKLGSGKIPPCVCLLRACWNLCLWPGLACRLPSWSASTRFPRRSIGPGGKGSRGWHPCAPPWGGSQGLWGSGAPCPLSSPAPHPLASWYSPSSPSAPSSPTWTAFPWSLCLAAVAIMKIYRLGWDLPMWILKCKYLRASGERALENVFQLSSIWSISNGGMWACDWSYCPFLYVNVCEVTGHVASHLYLCFWLLCKKLLRSWKLLKLYWSESESAADVKYCCYEFHLCCSYQAYLDLCDQLVVQEILPVPFLRLAIADPFKTKQEAQDVLEILDEPPC